MLVIQDNSAPPKDRGLSRKKIRKKVAEILKNATDAGPRVFPNASTPPWAEDLPVILVYARAEPVTPFSEAPRELKRDLDLTIEIIAEGPEVDEDGNEPVGKKSVEDIVDEIAEQVECAMSKDETLQGTADNSILTNTDLEFEGTGAAPTGSARLTYAIEYVTNSPRSVDKQGGLVDFDTAQVDFNIGEDENTRESKDTIDLT